MTREHALAAQAIEHETSSHKATQSSFDREIDAHKADKLSLEKERRHAEEFLHWLDKWAHAAGEGR